MSDTVQTATFAPGARVTFNGYDGDPGPLIAGSEVVVQTIREDGSLVVVDDNGATDVVFDVEVRTIEGEAQEVAAPAPKGKAKQAAKVKAPAKAKEPAAKAPKQEAAPAAKVKASTKTKAATSASVKEVVEVEVAEEGAYQTTTQDAVGEAEDTVAVQDSDEVVKILAEQDALAAARSLVARNEETYFTLGGVLAHIYGEGIYKSAGYTGKRGFEEYVQAELGIAYRKAMYLIDIYKAFRAIGMDEKRLTQIGWSKAKELTNYVNAENAETLIQAAADARNRDELADYLKTSFVGEGSTGGSTTERVKKTRFAVSLHADQSETVERALTVAKEKQGSDNLASALEFICAEWLAMSEGVEVPVEAEIERIQRRFGVTLVVDGPLDPETQAAA